MVTKNENGEYKKRIIPYYLARFIDGGIVNVSKILQSGKLDELLNQSSLLF